MTTLQTQSIESTDHDAPGAATSRQQSLLGILLKDALVILLLLVGVELLLRAVAPEYHQQVYDYAYTGSVPVAMNQQGHRGPTVPLAKAPGELRILALGDSVTWGTGVKASDAWPAQLQKMLQARHAGPIHVINAAIPGASVDALRQAYQDTWKKFKPDVVILVTTANMVSRQWVEAGRLPRKQINPWEVHPENWSWSKKLRIQVKRAMGRLCLPSFFSINTQRLMYAIGLLHHDVDLKTPYGPMVPYGYVQPGLAANAADLAWNAFGQGLRRFNQTLQQDRVRVLCGYIAPRFAIWNDWRDNEKHVPRDRLLCDAQKAFEAICNQARLSQIPLVPALRAAREQSPDKPALFITFDYNHLDRRGHQAVAAALAASKMITAE